MRLRNIVLATVFVVFGLALGCAQGPHFTAEGEHATATGVFRIPVDSFFFEDVGTLTLDATCNPGMAKIVGRKGKEVIPVQSAEQAQAGLNELHTMIINKCLPEHEEENARSLEYLRQCLAVSFPGAL
jgi:hypothetical protein